MRLRLSNREVVVDVELGDNDDAPVPPLLFIPLIENAFKYGTQSQDYEPVYISLKAGADTVVCRTRNSFTIGGNAPDGERSSGIGLANLRRRLHLIYAALPRFRHRRKAILLPPSLYCLFQSVIIQSDECYGEMYCGR